MIYSSLDQSRAVGIFPVTNRGNQMTTNGVAHPFDAEMALNSGSWQLFSKAAAASKPDFICCISRKMPRLAEILGLGDLPDVELISERALPWLDPSTTSDKEFLILDDTLNRGSTLDHVVSCARASGFESVRSRVWGRRIEMRQYSDQVTDAFEFETSVELDEPSYWRSQHLIPHLITKLGKPYDVDFPIFSAALSDVVLKMTEQQRLRLLLDSFHNCYSLTTPYQRWNGIESYSITLLPSLLNPKLFESHNSLPFISKDSMAKLRVIFDIHKRKIRIVPIVVQEIPSDQIRKFSGFQCERLNELYKANISKYQAGNPYELEPGFLLFLYLSCCDYLYSHQGALPLLLGLMASTPSSEQADLQLTFGPNLSQHLCSEINSILADHTARASGHTKASRPPVEIAETERKMCRLPHELKPYSSHFKPPESFIRSALKQLADSVERETLSLGPARIAEAYRLLRRGLSIKQLRNRLKEKKFLLADIDFSALVDFVIDRGIAVPVVNENMGSYCRVYRLGENFEQDPRVTINYLLHDYTTMLEDIPEITSVAFEKAICALAIFHHEAFPLTLVFGEFGAVACVSQDTPIGSEYRVQRFVEQLREDSYIIETKRRAGKQQGPTTGNLPFEVEADK